MGRIDLAALWKSQRGPTKHCWIETSGLLAGMPKLVLFFCDLILVLTPLIWNYLSDHNFQPGWLEDLFWIMFVLCGFCGVIWAMGILQEIKTTPWILPLGIICSLLAFSTVIIPRECVYEANLPMLTRRVIEHERGWPVALGACGDKITGSLMAGVVNTLYWSATISFVVSTIKKIKKFPIPKGV